MGSQALGNNLELHISPEALDEIRSLQQETRHLTLSSEDADQWNYVWGNNMPQANSINSVSKHCFPGGL